MATLFFLILVSVIISIISEFASNSSWISLSLLQWKVNISGFFWLTGTKEKWFKKVSPKQKPEESSLFKLLKEDKY